MTHRLGHTEEGDSVGGVQQCSKSPPFCRWQNEQADLGHAIVAVDVMANTLSHPKVDVAHFWTTRWRFGGFAPSNTPGSAADALEVSADQDPSSFGIVG